MIDSAILGVVALVPTMIKIYLIFLVATKRLYSSQSSACENEKSLILKVYE